jgi:hypothetical protein
MKLDDLLNSQALPTPLESPAVDRLPPEVFEALEQEMNALRERIKAGETTTEEENRKIIAYFRARRALKFVLKKPPKEKKARAPAKKKVNSELAKLAPDELFAKLGL